LASIIINLNKTSWFSKNLYSKELRLLMNFLSYVNENNIYVLNKIIYTT
jgi:hypothetical protein